MLGVYQCLKQNSVSAGFDAAAGDELGECLVSPAGYAHMTHMLAGLANGRMVVALEVSTILLRACDSDSIFLPNKGWL